MADETEVKTAPERDEVKISTGSPAAPSKVELDLDDAPFLQPEEPAVAESEPQDTLPATEELPPPDNKRKKLIIIGAAALIVILAGVAVWWFFLRGPAVPPPPEPDNSPQVVVVPSVQTPDIKKEFVKRFEPFIVPLGATGEPTRFLVCSFSTISTDGGADTEIEKNMIALRDAMFFYLRSKTAEFLMDPRSQKEIKSNLTAVVNDGLLRSKVDDVLFESYIAE